MKRIRYDLWLLWEVETFDWIRSSDRKILVSIISIPIAITLTIIYITTIPLRLFL